MTLKGQVLFNISTLFLYSSKMMVVNLHCGLLLA